MNLFKIKSFGFLLLPLMFILMSCSKKQHKDGSMQTDSTQMKSQSGRTKDQTNSMQNNTLKIKISRKKPFGRYLTNGKGRSYYLFVQDSTNQSTCYESCAATWPPVLVKDKSSVKTAKDVDSTMVGITRRKNGDLQLTIDNHPIYYYIVDQKAGQVNGQDIDQYGAEWYLVKPNGKEMGDVRKK